MQLLERSLGPLRSCTRRDSAKKQPELASSPPPSLTHTSCPYLHGTAVVDPYPGGFVHGKNPAVCPHGCVPQFDSMLRQHETPRERLVREAKEFHDLYSAEKNVEPLAREQRWAVIMSEIESSGTYELTFDELEHGLRVSWRNAPKCPNRAQWKCIKLLDHRDATTNEQMFDACMEHLGLAINSGVTECYCTCFRAQTPGTSDGPRVWNDQLLQYAAYRMPTDEMPDNIVGDPARLAFTQMLTTMFGWQPKGGPGSFDVLPLVMQASPDVLPSLFEIPPGLTAQIDIWHPGACANPPLTWEGLSLLQGPARRWSPFHSREKG